jgi:excinuclease ABC subunit C
LKNYKSVKRIKEASLENLAETIGMSKAKKIYENFH